MRNWMFFVLFCCLVSNIWADVPQGEKVYDCEYMEKPPYGVTAWSQSEMVGKRFGKATRFAPYNSDSAKGLINNVNALRTIYEDTNKEDTETSFYMVYGKQGWCAVKNRKRPIFARAVSI